MMKLKRGIRNLVVIIFLLSNIGCDQITKVAARNNIEDGERISVVADYLTLTKVENSGAFLSLGDNWPYIIRTLLLTILPALILAGMLVFVLRERKMTFNQSIPLAFIIGGGIGNLFDRILYGSVTDFLHMNFQVFKTGIFNMADVSIMIGTFWLIYTQLKTTQLTNKQMESS